jgi:hypothetical protein
MVSSSRMLLVVALNVSDSDTVQGGPVALEPMAALLPTGVEALRPE